MIEAGFFPERYFGVEQDIVETAVFLLEGAAWYGASEFVDLFDG